jgi:hypothetical protein
MSLSPWRRPRRWLLVLAFVVLPGVIGCGPRVGSVTGTVSYKGTPLKGGNLAFVTANNQSFGSPIGEDGHYAVNKVPAGPVKITVETASLKQEAMSARKYAPPPGAAVPEGYKMSDPTAARRDYVPIPGKYATVDQSGLSYTVTPGTQTFDVKLE